MITKDTAICIRAIDYSETSQILTFFTRDTGKIGAIAKGSKRPKSSFGGPFEIFSYGKIVFAESNKDKLSTLTEFESSFGGAGFRHPFHLIALLRCHLKISFIGSCSTTIQQSGSGKNPGPRANGHCNFC